MLTPMSRSVLRWPIASYRSAPEKPFMLMSPDLKPRAVRSRLTICDCAMFEAEFVRDLTLILPLLKWSLASFLEVVRFFLYSVTLRQPGTPGLKRCVHGCPPYGPA